MELSCRVCFQEEEVMVDIFEEVENFESDLSLLLEQCGGLEVRKSDVYSHYLCKDCTSDLLVAAKFREKCERAKKMMEDMVEEKMILVKNEKLKSQGKTMNVDVENDVLSEFLLLKGNTDKENYEVTGDDAGITDEMVIGEVNPTSDTQIFLEDFIEAEDLVEQDDTKLNGIENSVQKDLAKKDSEIIVLSVEDIQPNDKCLEDNLEPSTVIHSNSNIILFKDEKNFICDSCGAAFSHYINLHRHLQSVHMQQNLFTCANCHHAFTREANVAKHLEICKTFSNIQGSGRKEPLFNSMSNVCRYCGKANASLFALNMHLRTHTGERPFKCSHCAKAFKTQSALQIHLKRHLKIPDLACPTCGKTFYETNNLKAHLNIHTGKKPHVCAICCKSFSRVFLLQNHIRIHTGERPYQCQFCEKRFIQLTDRKTHELSHTGERPFKCEICQKGFKTRSLLKQHIVKYNHQTNSETIMYENIIQEKTQDIPD